MRRAALYAWNRGALVIVDDGPEGPVVVDALDLDVITADAGTLANMVTSSGAGRLLVPSRIEEAGRRPFPEEAHILAERVAVLCPSVEIVTVLESSRKARRGAAQKALPRGNATEATRDALAMVFADGAPPSEPVYLRAVATPGEDVGSLDPMPSLASVRGIALAEALCGPLPPGPRVAGIDPGERWIAVAIGAETGITRRPLTYVASLVVEIERTGKEQPTDEQLDAAVGKAVDFCELHGATRVAVERAVNVHRAPGKSAEEGAGLAAYLLRGQYVAGMLRGALRAARNAAGGPLVGGKVESVSSVKGRNHVRRLAGAGIGKDSPWQPAARAALGGTIPAGVGEHVLDAAVCAVWVVRPEDAPAAPRAPCEPGQPRGSRGTAKRAAARLAAGCHCPSSRHTAPTCPIRLAANAARASAMAGNGNAAR